MILVDIYVPSVDKEYNFNLNESVPIKTILEEITEMIGQKEKTFLNGNLDNIVLCSKDMQSILPKNLSLAECNILTGSSLFLV